MDGGNAPSALNARDAKRALLGDGKRGVGELLHVDQHGQRKEGKKETASRGARPQLFIAPVPPPRANKTKARHPGPCDRVTHHAVSCAAKFASSDIHALPACVKSTRPDLQKYQNLDV